MAKVLLGVLLICVSIFAVQSKELEHFVERLLEKYPSWLAANNMDPSTSLEGPFLVDMQGTDSGLTAEISNIRIEGHSIGNATQLAFEFHPPSDNPAAYPSDIWIEFLFGSHNSIISGDYKINGTLNGDSVVNGSGTWTARPDPDTQFRLIMRYGLFNFEHDGLGRPHLGLRRASVKTAMFVFWGTKTFTMTGLEADGQEYYVRNTVLNTFFGLERSNKEMPFMAQFLGYVEDAFEKNPFQP